MSLVSRTPSAAIALAVVAALGLSACGDKADSKDGSSLAKTTSVTADTGLTKATFFRTVTDAQLKAKTAHMSMAIGAAGQTIKADGDVQIGTTIAENAVSMSMNMGSALPGKLKMVLAKGSFYLNFGQLTDNKFAKIDLKDKNNPLSKQFGQLLDQMDPSTQFKQFEGALTSFEEKGSPISIDGVKAQPYQLELDTSKIAAFSDVPTSAAKGIPATLKYTMFVGPDNLLRRVTFDAAGSSSQIEFSKWGESVDIKAPAAADISDKDFGALLGGAAPSA